MEMRISNALKMLAEKVTEAGDKELPLLLNAGASAIEDLKTERDALKTQVERLREVIEHYKQGLVPSDNAMDELITRVGATPEQCLAEIEARAGRDGFVAGVKALERAKAGYDTHFDVEFECEHYSEQVRQQAAKVGG